MLSFWLLRICTDDLTLPGSSDIVDPVDYGNHFALNDDDVIVRIHQFIKQRRADRPLKTCT